MSWWEDDFDPPEVPHLTVDVTIDEPIGVLWMPDGSAIEVMPHRILFGYQPPPTTQETTAHDE